MKVIYILFFTLFSFVLFAQPVETQIFSEDAGDPGDNTVIVTFYNGFQNFGSLNFFGTAEVQSNEPSSGYDGASGVGNILINNDGPRFCRIGNINTQNYVFLKLSFGIHKNTTDSDGSGIAFEFSLDGGFNFNPLPMPALPTGPGTDTWHHINVNLPFTAQNQENLVIQYRRITPVVDSTLYRIDDISLIGDYFIPVISPSEDSLFLPPVAVGDFDSIEYTVSATFLIQDVEVVSENPSFEIFDPVDSVWGLSLTLPKDGQGLEDQPVTILIRHIPLDAIGDDVGVFRHSTFGGQDTIVHVFGTAIAAEPLIVTPSFTATPNANGLIHLQWEPGDGNRRLIIARQTLQIEWQPTDGVPPLPANEDFSLASDIDGHKIVFDADSSLTQATIYGLNPATTYHFAIFEYNVGTGNSHNYLTDTFELAQAFTAYGPPGLQVEQTSTAYLINFQETVPGVLNGAYAGTGLSPSNTPGRLNTSSWRVSINSGPGGTTQYNSPATSSPLFGRGYNAGPSATNGIYAFQTGEGNIALGVKPFQQVNSNVFSVSPGGFFELRSQNKTNQTVEEVYISFVYFVLNNGNFSTDFKFSYSLNGSTFTEVPELSFETPAELDNPSAWKKYVRSIKIPGLTIPNDGFLYIRWTGQDGVVTMGTRDAIAIDDITVAFDPEPTFAGGTFSGNINSGILAANARLNGATTIIDSIVLNEGAVLSTGNNTLTLGPGVSIDETDGYIKGNLVVSRVIEANVAQTFGGIGLSITTPVAAGLTLVKRITGSYVLSGDNESIRRIFEISPANNSNLNATMAFTFEDFESPNFTPTQANFRLYRRHINSQGGWAVMNPGILTGTTYTISGIASFNDQITGANVNEPLPLDWLSFDVSHDKGFNLLKWVTANEVNTSDFEIEKSHNGKDFVSIATLTAKGGNSETYIYADKHDRPGLIYYRIKQIDRDQKFSYSPLRSVIVTSNQKLQVYPTLVSDHTMVFSDEDMEAQISIVNAQGALVKQFDLQLSAGEQTLSIQDLISGVYWIRFENKEINETFRIVKQ